MTDLWPHQVSLLESAHTACRSYKRIVLQLPTGGGKTRLGTELVRRAVAKHRRALWIAHRTELVGQAFDTLERAGLAPGCLAAECDRPARESSVQVASIDTLIARNLMPDADLVIPDECHHFGEGAETYAAFLDRYSHAYILGLTATPERGDGTGLGPFFQHLIQSVSVRDLTLSGHLVPCEVVRPDTFLKGGEGGNKLAQDPVEAYVEHGAGEPCLLFASSVENAQRYAEQLCARGIVARCIHAKTPADERKSMLAGFRKGTVRVLTNVYVLTEGTDLPMASVCVLARGCSTVGMMLQIVGRVLRSASGKKRAILVDLPGITHLHGMPEDERIWSLDGRACRVKDGKCPVCHKPAESFPCVICGYAPDASGEGKSIEDQIVAAKMALVERLLAKTEEQQQEMLLRWMVEAALKGRRAGSVMARWNNLFPVPLSWRWYGHALKACKTDLNPAVKQWAEEESSRMAAKRRERASC